MDTRAPKRQKVATACDPCRGRKVKCDGHQPMCGPCEKRSKSVSCTWATDFSHAPSVSADYIKRLEGQIKLLEARNSQGSQISASNNPSSNSASEDLSAETMSSHGATTSASPASATWLSTVAWEGYPSMNTPEMSTNQWQSNLAPTISPGLVPSFQELSKSIDTMCTSSNPPSHNIVVDHNHGTGVIEKPFAQSFMQEVENLVVEKIGEASTHASNVLGFDLNIPSSRITTHESQLRNLDYALPSREQADSLLTSYFENVHVFYPFLDRLELREEYERIWRCDNYTTDQGSLICLINSVFAISSRQTRTTVSNHENMASIFCRRAQGFLNIQECSVRSVQSYLLLALYFQSMGESRTCWLYVGNAIRTAQLLELHLPETSERIVKSQARDSLRKAWHTCVLMDREVSMLYGRPSMIDPQTATTIPLPLLTEEDNYQQRHNEGSTTEKPPTYTAEFYKSGLKLYDILYVVLLDSRHGKPDRNLKKVRCTSENTSSAGTNISILNLQERLSNWERDNPDHLRIENHSTSNDPNAVLSRRASVLHQRYLHIHLLLLTPVLQQIICTEFQNKTERIPLGTLLSHRISLQCAIVCVKIAQEAIDTIHLRETSGSNEIPASWCNVTFLYKSATVLIAGGLCPSIVAEISEASIHESFYKATAILRQYTTFNSSVLRLVTILDILFQIVPQKFSRLKKASQRIETEAGPPTPDDDNSAATFQYWCPIKPIRHAASAHQDTVQSSPENSGSSQILTDLDRLFDTDDFTWLTKMPLNT
ncbi:putative c6 transcription protein [Botrytis fragariae]|uniref:Putative c6 transcription protein n=1 Tax=Botrytis fragariae TaxID=1964551 RepID=A0A8H6EF40_9HELO|nr:putative c6 transcription protein [Botrytis fragariae]KAF5869565.1 putative c6 transcription protein [Botrytis fragariae]